MQTITTLMPVEILLELGPEGRLFDYCITPEDGCYGYREKQFGRFCHSGNSVVSLRLKDDRDVDGVMDLLDRMTISVVHRRGEHYPALTPAQRLLAWLEYRAPKALRATYFVCRRTLWRLRETFFRQPLDDVPF